MGYSFIQNNGMNNLERSL